MNGCIYAMGATCVLTSLVMAQPSPGSISPLLGLNTEAASVQGASGAFELHGSFGLILAETLSGNGFELRGGFWVASPVTCDADCDGNGVIDAFDLLCFADALSAGDSRADCDKSGVLDAFDLLCFSRALNAGCP